MLCLAEYIAGHLTELPHNVLLVFQPAEETTGGAKDICASGVFEAHNVCRIFGLHLWPSLPAGVVATKSGPLMARSSELTVEIAGRSAHIARQDEGIDALYAATELVRRCYEIIEKMEPEQFCLLRFGRMQSGTARNAVSASTRLEGTLRTFSDDLHRALTERILEISHNIEKELGCQISVQLSEGYPPVTNSALLLGRYANTWERGAFFLLDKPTLITEDFFFTNSACLACFFPGYRRGGAAAFRPFQL